MTSQWLIVLLVICSFASSEKVVEIIVRKLKTDVDSFKAARTPVITAIKKSSGLDFTREFEAVVDYSTADFSAPATPVFIGVNQYASMNDYFAAAGAIQETAEFKKFATTFDVQGFHVVTPLKGENSANAELAIVGGAGSLNEFSFRDLTGYDNFVELDYNSARDNFLSGLVANDGIKSQQWVDVDPFGVAPNNKYTVGTTQYESQNVYSGLATADGFFSTEASTNFVGNYPMASGYLTVECCTEAAPKEDERCVQWAAWCNTGNQWMKDNCQQTCTTPARKDSCRLWSAYCESSNDWMNQHCQGTCALVQELAQLKKKSC